MDPTQLPPDVLQMLTALSNKHGGWPNSMNLPQGSDLHASLGNQEMPAVPPAMAGPDASGLATAASQPNMPPEVSQMLTSLEGGNIPTQSPFETGAPGYTAGLGSPQYQAGASATTPTPDWQGAGGVLNAPFGGIGGTPYSGAPAPQTSLAGSGTGSPR